MKFVSLNTHSWMEEDALNKLKETADFLINQDIDVIALQEINQRIDAEEIGSDSFYCAIEGQQINVKKDNYARELVLYLREKGYNYYWSWACSHIGYDIYDEGSAILSKQPFEAESLLVSPMDDPTDYHTRQLVLAHFKNEEVPLTVASCHFSWWSEDKQEGFYYEWEQLLSRLSQLPHHQVMLFGDFNAPAHIKDEGYSLVTETFTDVFELATKKEGSFTVDENIDGWADNKEKLRIDFGFVLKSMNVLSYQVIFNDIMGSIVSDHFGIMIETAP
ncbi:endonuclease/exonuclease/phosphatase family protein [Vagococcus sp.]|uniref:endonuclease/exonuclease/phosphatase family protein n=1 Tax=Vagococcus sp. TaxID=1933889 RepID=UPI002FC8556B